jgi:hypothetical protein
MSHLIKRPGSMRPMMDPTFVDEAEETSASARWRRHLVSVLRWFGRALLQNPLSHYKPDEPRPSVVRVLLRAAACWAVLLPLLTVGLAVVLVNAGTRPAPPPAVLDPTSQGCYFDTVTFDSADGTSLTGWMIPVIDAHRVLAEKDKVLRWKRPGIVLVHDFGQSPQQLLPLAKPLHDEGLNVLLLGVRGLGTDKAVGQTFGIREAQDVAAAVTILRNTRFVDPKRVAVAGIGSGANAVLLAAERDPSISAIIIANPLTSCDAAITRYVAHDDTHLRWMRPLLLWTFELTYAVHADEVGYPKNAVAVRSRPILSFTDGDPLTFADADHQQKIREFCRTTLQPRERIILGSAGRELPN